MARTAKAKGRLGQNEIRDKILETFPDLEPDDVRSTTMGDTGEDIQLSPAARKKIPIKIRIKNLINIPFDVIENNWYAMKIKRKIIDTIDSFLNPFQNFL